MKDRTPSIFIHGFESVKVGPMDVVGTRRKITRDFRIDHRYLRVYSSVPGGSSRRADFPESTTLAHSIQERIPSEALPMTSGSVDADVERSVPRLRALLVQFNVTPPRTVEGRAQCHRIRPTSSMNSPAKRKGRDSRGSVYTFYLQYNPRIKHGGCLSMDISERLSLTTKRTTYLAVYDSSIP